MANTGLFFVYEVVLFSAEEGRPSPSQIQRIRADCLQCHHAFTASNQPALTNIPGGGANLHCEQCGSRQSIARARLEDRILLPSSGRTRRDLDTNRFSQLG